MRMNIQDTPLSKLTPYARNSKTHPKDQVDKIARQISQVGFLVPIIVDKNLVIIAGHGRFAAAKALNLPSVPIVIADHLTEEEATAFRIADNKVAESEWDKPLLAFEMGTLDRLDFDLTLTGFTMEEITPLLNDFNAAEHSDGAGSKEEDEVPAMPRIIHSKRGDVWQLGDHTLMCGDSTSFDDVQVLLNGRKPTFLFTDPPYGINVVGKNGMIGGNANSEAKIYRPVHGDGDTEMARLALALISELKIQKQMIWGGNYFTNFLPPTPCWIIWDKQRGEGTTFADGEMAWTSFTSPVKFIRHTWDGFRKDSEKGEEREHPTQKPSFLAEWALKTYGEGQELVLDLFGGSGSTLIGAQNSGHKAIVMEYDAGYCDVILERFARLTQKDPVRHDGALWSAIKVGIEAAEGDDRE